MQQRWHEPLANVGGKEGNKAGLAGSGKRVGWALPVGPSLGSVWLGWANTLSQRPAAQGSQ